MKYVSETSAAKSISVYVILKRHREIARVLAHFSNGGTCLVNVFNYGDKNKSAHLNAQSGRAGGYGYDKFTAALAGLEIDGHKLTNHCGGRKNPPPSGVWPRDAVAPRGWSFANWHYRDSEGNELPKSKRGWSSCYRKSGLDYLKALGYTVIHAL